MGRTEHRENTMRYFYDCEFLEDGRTIDLISIGIMAEDDRELYLVNSNAPWSRIAEHEWLMANVVPHLPLGSEYDGLCPDYNHPAVQSHHSIAERVREFITGDRKENELWAYYGAYDHVVLCQLWGQMLDLPPSVPMFTRDIKQEHARLGSPPLPKQCDGEHNALADARYNRLMFDFLTGYVDGSGI